SILYEACFGALREKGQARGPSLIAMYEYAYVGWTPHQIAGGRYYVDISAELDIKRAALATYRSQSCPPLHPCSVEAMETLARMCGIECGRTYAELFYVLKMVDGRAT